MHLLVKPKNFAVFQSRVNLITDLQSICLPSSSQVIYFQGLIANFGWTPFSFLKLPHKVLAGRFGQSLLAFVLIL